MVSTHGTGDAGSIRAARQAARLTQQELARRVGCSMAYLRVIEAGYTPASSTILPRIVAVLDEIELGVDAPSSKTTADAGGGSRGRH